MVAATVGENTNEFQKEDVGDYAATQSEKMFEEGRSFSGNERFKLFLGRGDGTFEDLSALAGADSNLDGRGLLAVDLDDDGDIELFSHNLQRQRHTLFRNNLGQSRGGFLKVRLKATTLNPEAVGAIVTVTTSKGPVSQVLSRGAGMSSCQVPELIFGLGKDAEATVSVFWPGGAEQSFGSLEAGSRVHLVEGGKAVPFEALPALLPDPLPLGLTIRQGEVVPNLTLLNADGEPTTLDVRALAQGRQLYLNFWASSCQPCIAELPTFASHQAAGDYNVAFISTDSVSKRSEATAILAEKSPGIPAFYLNENGDDIEQLIEFEFLPLPTTLVLDAKGKVLQVIRGQIK